EKDRHQEGGHLVLLDAATRVPVEERAQLVAAQLTAIPLAADHLVWCHLVRFQWSASDSGAGSPRETRPHTSKISAIQSQIDRKSVVWGNSAERGDTHTVSR